MAASGVELATAYISLVPSFKGGRAKLGEEFGEPLEQEAERSGKEAGKKAGNSFGDSFSGTVKGVIGTAALWGGGTLLANGFNEALTEADLPAQFGRTLDLAGPAAQAAGQAAGEVYASGFGATMQETATATEAVISSIDGMRDASTDAVEDMTAKAQALAQTFTVDVGRAAQVAGRLITDDLVADGTAALDLLVYGMQRVPAAVREDILDAADEYGPFFKLLGLNGRQAFDLLIQGSAQGMYGIDKTGDALKELTIRATDMSTGTKDAYKAIGLSADQMTADILAGGDRANGAFASIVNGLLKIKDPAAQSAAALALFGTPLEDLAVSEIPRFLQSLVTAEDSMKGVSGSAAELASSMEGDLQQQMVALGREFDSSVAGAIAPMIPMLHELLAALQPYMPVIGPIVIGLAGLTAATWLWNAGLGAVLKAGGSFLVWLAKGAKSLVIFAARTAIAAVAMISRMVPAITATVMSMLRYVAVQTMVVARTVAGWILMGAQALLQAGRIAAAWLIAMGPIGWVIAAIIALVVLVIVYFDEIVAAISAAWEWVKQAAQAAWDWVIALLRGALEWIVQMFLNWTLPGLVIKHWDTITGAFRGALEWIKSAARSALDWVGARWRAFSNLISGIVNRVKGFLGSIWDGLKDGAKAAANFAIGVINGLITGANFAISGLNIVPGVSIPHIPHIPYLASGGITTGPTLAMIGEGPEREAVMPLTKLDSLLNAQSGAAPVVQLDLTGDRHLVAWLRSMVRTQGGGNVQAALGKGTG